MRCARIGLLLSMFLLPGCPGDETPVPDPIDPADLLQFEDGERPQNLLFVSVDTLRRDVVGRWSGGPSDTPFVDSFLQQGVALEQAQSCGNWTPAGFACANSGRTTLESGWFPQIDQEDFGIQRLPADWQWLGDALDTAGYSRTLVNSNEHVNVPGMGFLDSFGSVESVGDAGGAVVTSTALAAADDLVGQEDPWFLHVHYMDPHTPYIPPDSYLEGIDALAEVDPLYETFAFDGQLREDWPNLTTEEREAIIARLWFRYRAEVRYWDDSVRDLIGGLETRGLLDDTLVVLWSDHGEAMGDRGWFTHAVHVYRDERAVMAGFWSSTLLPRAYDPPTRLADLVPVVFAALGLDQDEALQGFTSGFESPSLGHEAADRSIISFCDWCEECNGAPVLSVRQGDRTLVYDWRGVATSFDLAGDPLEGADLWDPDDATAQALWDVAWSQAEDISTALDLEWQPVLPPGLDR